MAQTDPRSRLCFALSPLALVTICAAIQFTAGRYVGVWAWVPTLLGFWLVIALLLHNDPSAPRPRQRFRRPAGSPFWSVLAVLAGLLSLPGFLGTGHSCMISVPIESIPSLATHAASHPHERPIATGPAL